MEVISTQEAFELEASPDVGVVRRRSAALAVDAGLDEARAGDAALIATELASNVLKHAQRGGALIGLARSAGPGDDGGGERRGVAIVAWDRGPGMHLDACLRDGMSTAGTRGAGLGAVARIASRFDAYTRPGHGSVISAVVFAGSRAPPPRFMLGGVCVPYPGAWVSGDAWESHVDNDVATVMLCDGLGHGEGAAAAAAAALAAFRAAPTAALPEILARAHAAARSTRGAAGTLVRIDRARRELVVAGIGNVAAWLVGDTTRQLVTQHGTLGQAAPSEFREERHAIAPGALVVLCSDGLRSRLHLADHPGLTARDPATIAATLWRDLTRGRDDASAVVLREAAA
jgi:anti-sigma regulatory factor (Ser/Thr protein kinase)